MKQKLSILTALILGWTMAGAAPATEPESNPRDVLVYKDGDRVQGRLVEKKGEIIVFQSDRFGELRVPADKAVVIPAEKPAEAVATLSEPGVRPPATAATEKTKAGEPARAGAEWLPLWEWLSPAVLTARLREFFGPWHGKFAFSLEQISNTAEQNNVGVEMTLQRKWKSDEVQLKGRYDLSETNSLTTTDLIKADGVWRHDFTMNVFALYHSNLEWNRASFKQGAPNDYVQVQQEIGTGVSIRPTDRRKVRLGLSENLFDIWDTTPNGTHTSRAVESAFLETELKLPWRMNLSQRGVYYYAFTSGGDGWENRIELSKRFTETLSTSIRQEMRRYNPDGRTQDYTRLKLLFAVDF
jgi:hypothetical protein